jgi:hypothetical protein
MILMMPTFQTQSKLQTKRTALFWGTACLKQKKTGLADSFSYIIPVKTDFYTFCAPSAAQKFRTDARQRFIPQIPSSLLHPECPGAHKSFIVSDKSKSLRAM